MASAMGVAPSSAVSGVQTTVLVPASEAVEVMRKAGKVAGIYGYVYARCAACGFV